MVAIMGRFCSSGSASRLWVGVLGGLLTPATAYTITVTSTPSSADSSSTTQTSTTTSAPTTQTSPAPTGVCAGIIGNPISNPDELESLSGCAIYPGGLTFWSYQWPSGVPATIDISQLTAIQGSLTFSDISAPDERGFSIEASGLTSVSGGLTTSNVTGLIWREEDISSDIQVIAFDKVRFHGSSKLGLSLGNASMVTLSDTNLETLAIDAGFTPQSPSPTSLPPSDISDAIESKGGASFPDDTSPTSTVSATSIFGTIYVVSNAALVQLALPTISASVSAMSISNNTQLRMIDLASITAVSQLNIVGPVDSIIAHKLLSVDTVSVTVNKGGNFPCGDKLGNLAINTPFCFSGGTINPLTPTASSTSSISGITVSHHTTATSSSSSSTATSTNPTSPTSTTHRTSSGLSSAAKIGVGVGIGVGGALIILAIVVCCIRSRRSRSSSHSPATATMLPKERPTDNTVSYGSYNATPFSTSETTPPAGTTCFSSGYVDEPRHEDVENAQRSLGVINPESLMKENPTGMHEMEEQQGVRHEMDARSLPDIDFSDAEGSVDHRSLDDIERIHGRGLE